MGALSAHDLLRSVTLLHFGGLGRGTGAHVYSVIVFLQRQNKEWHIRGRARECESAEVCAVSWWMLARACAGNNISDVGAKAIAQALPSCNLQELDLGGTCHDPFLPRTV